MFLAFKKSIFFLAVVCIILVVVFYNQTDQILDLFALHPQNWNFSYSAFTSPWLHGNLDHLLGNLLSIISLSAIFMLLFPTNWLRFFISQYILSSVLFFFIATPNTQHIGASVWVYAFASFILTIILLQPNKKLFAIFFVTVLFYGGMWWGLLPLIPHVSYEGHISGTIAGIVSALIDRKFYINLLPKRKIPQWFHLENEEKNPYDSI